MLWLRLLAGLLLCVGSVAVIAAPAAQAVKTASLEYKGSLVAEAPAAFESRGNVEHNYGKQKLEVSWVATAVEPIEAQHMTLPEWNFETLTGHFHIDHEGSEFPIPGQQVPPPCDATLSRRPAGPGTGILVFADPEGAEESEVEVVTGIPASTAVLQSSDTDEDSPCSTPLQILDEYITGGTTETEARTDGVTEALKLAFDPNLTEPASGLWSAPFNVEWTREVPEGAGDPYVLKIVSSISVGTSTSTTETPRNPGNPASPGPSSDATPTTVAPGTTLSGDKVDSAAHTATLRFKGTGDSTGFECRLSSGKDRRSSRPASHPGPIAN